MCMGLSNRHRRRLYIQRNARHKRPNFNPRVCGKWPEIVYVAIIGAARVTTIFAIYSLHSPNRFLRYFFRVLSLSDDVNCPRKDERCLRTAEVVLCEVFSVILNTESLFGENDHVIKGCTFI